MFAIKTKAQKVALAGSFNNWDTKADVLEKDEDGIWRIQKDLPPGEYFYKFVINDSLWLADPSNPQKSKDSWNNSVLTINENGRIIMEDKKVNKNDPGYYYLNEKARKSPTWLRQAVIYEVFARAYSKKGFNGITEKIAYLKKLGIDILWLMPINPAGQKNRKGQLGSPYAIRDYYGINPEFGNANDFKELVETAHQNEIRVILDWVADHSAWDNPWIEQHPEWYTHDENGQIIPPNPDWTDTADLNYENKELRQEMIRAMSYWITEFDVDGFRCDVAALVPLDFWVEARSKLQKIKPELIMLSESEEKLHHLASFDLTYEKKIRNSLHKIAFENGNKHDFAEAYNLQKYNFPKNSLRMHWLENHDQVRALEYFGENYIYPASVVQFTIEGVPLLFMGQEFGDRNWKKWESLFDPIQLNWENFDNKLFAHYKALVKLRKEHAALTSSDFKILDCGHEKTVAYLKKSQKEQILVVTNFSDEESKIDLNCDELKSGTIFFDLINEEEYGQRKITLLPFGYKILELR
ncbi:MAG: alpha-amylase family glycosyl hydrolase [Candidatus Cloacimonadota bacterium]|nr:alpha-amylase family glycosyl hydrolase [Candidatus Cloacimonadota bacterium]